MTNNTKENKLKKIIEYAVERGWDDKLFWGKDLPAIKKLDEWAYDAWITHILFSHDFAKAVFGEEVKELNCVHKTRSKYCVECLRADLFEIVKEGWQYHLQQAVISKDPIEYYYKFITQRK